MEADWQKITLRLFVALICGILIGLERQWHQRSAGLRTNVLVSIGAAGFTLFGTMDHDVQSLARIVSQIVSGIGFLGAGAIMRDGFNVRGLNTAATLWCSAAVGVFSGGGFFLAGFIFSSFVMLVNIILRPLIPFIQTSKDPNVQSNAVSIYYSLELKCEHHQESQARSIVLQSAAIHPILLKSMETEQDQETKIVSMVCIFKASEQCDDFLELLVSALLLEPRITSVKWRMLDNYHEGQD